MKLLLTTILMIVCLVAYAATPSYSNFSSNQFLPSGTYTVTVKNKPLLTNMFEYGLFSLTNAQFGGVSTITNGQSNMVFNVPFQQQLQYDFQTGGVPSMVISNGRVGILKANPGFALDVNGSIAANNGSIRVVDGGFTLNLSSRGSVWAPSNSVIQLNNNQLDNGAVLQMSAVTNTFVNDGATWTLLYSKGTNFVISDGIQADSQFGQFNQFTFSTSGTPVMVISNGIVGIGTASPNSTGFGLHVPNGIYTQNGDLKTDGNLRANQLLTGSSISINVPAENYLTFVNLLFGTNGAPFFFKATTNDLTKYESATNTIIGSKGLYLSVGDAVAAPGSIIVQRPFMTPAEITNTLAVTAGQTNHMFVNTNGVLWDFWSDGFTIYSKQIAP